MYEKGRKSDKNMIRKLFMYCFPGLFIKLIDSKLAKRLYFIKEYEVMSRRILQGVFVREKIKEMREEIRREYDKANEDLDATKLALENLNKQPTPDPKVKELLEKREKDKKKDIEQFKVQIDALDKQLTESGGLEDLVDGYRAVKPLIKRLIMKGE